MKERQHLRRKSVELVLSYCQEIEVILGLKLGIKGANVKEKIKASRGRLPNDLQQKVIRIILIGEKATCDPKFQIHDFDNFTTKCDAVLQELNQFANPSSSYSLKHNSVYLMKQLLGIPLVLWLGSLLAHFKAVDLSSESNSYTIIFWSTLVFSVGAALFLGFLLKANPYSPKKSDIILQDILIVLMMLNPLTLTLTAIALFLLNLIH
ncbi:MAG: hypothetical protein WBA13_18260 [Microcoleaceae cyanobacterium]